MMIKLGPFNLQDILKEENVEFDHTLEVYEGFDDEGLSYFQQVTHSFDTRTFGRHVSKLGAIMEGQSLNDSRYLDGYGRILYSRGQYYIG